MSILYFRMCKECGNELTGLGHTEPPSHGKRRLSAEGGRLPAHFLFYTTPWSMPEFDIYLLFYLGEGRGHPEYITDTKTLVNKSVHIHLA